MSIKINLWPNDPPSWNSADTRDRPWLDWHAHPDGGERSCVLIFPGGGYSIRAEHEGNPIADACHRAGFHAAVCHYRVQFPEAPQALMFGPLFDAQRAMRILRSRSQEFQIKNNNIACIGFSAGGHLCATLGVHWNHPTPEQDDLAGIYARPDALAPCYSVISTEDSCIHQGSFLNVLGENADASSLDFFSLEKHISTETPPIFLWHTADDAGVKLQNSLIFADYAQQHKVPVELHVFAHGKHGLGLAPDNAVVGQWWPLCAQWLHRYI